MHAEYVVGGSEEAHADEVLLRIVSALFHVRAHGELSHEAEEQGVAVRWCFRYLGGAYGSSRTGPVVHDELLPEPLAKLLTDEPCDEIVATAWRCRNHDAHRPGRIRLRERPLRDEREYRRQETRGPGSATLHRLLLV